MSRSTKKEQKKHEYSESDNNYTESKEDDNEVTTIKETNTKKSKKQNSKSDLNDEDIQKRAKENFLQTDFFEKVIKYVKTDNLMRKETSEFREKISTLKEEKQELEDFILKYLDFQEENIINIAGSGKLTKYESVRKKGINKDIIQQAIYNKIKEEQLVTDDKKLKEIVEATYNIMENSREKTVKTVLKRTFIKEKKEKVPKTKKQNIDEKEKKPKKSKKVE